MKDSLTGTPRSILTSSSISKSYTRDINDMMKDIKKAKLVKLLPFNEESQRIVGNL
jgi:hypothetical protein